MLNNKTRPIIVSLAALSLLASASIPTAQAHHVDGSKPHRGGSTAMRFFFTPTCLDPLNVPTNPISPQGVFDALVDSDEHGRIVPDLALRWKFSEGGKIVTFYLRRGVRFSNGDRLDARAVKQDFDYVWKFPGPNGNASFGPLMSVRVIGPYTLQLVMSSPFRPLLFYLTSQNIADVGAEQKEGDRACQNPIGSGAFKVSSVAPGLSEVRLVPNSLHRWAPAWHRNKGPAYLSSVVIKYIVSDETAVSELLAGDLDVTLVPATEVGRVQENPAITVRKSYPYRLLILTFNTRHAPFNQVKVRRAIAQAIDRKTLIRVVVGGHGKPAYSPIAPSNPYYDRKAPTYAPKYQPSQASRLLSTHHVSGPYTLVTNTIPQYSTTAEFIQAALAQVGVKVNLVTKPVLDAQAQMNKGDFDLAVDSWNGDDLFPVLHSSQAASLGTGGFNRTGYHSKELDRLLVQSRETVDPKRAKQVLARVQRFVDTHAIGVPLFNPETDTAVRTRLQGWHASQTGVTFVFPVLQDVYVKG